MIELLERLRNDDVVTQDLRKKAANTIEALLTLVYQYRSDLVRPPTGDSLERRLKATDEAIAKAVQP